MESIVGLYLHDVGQYPLLTREQEHDLAVLVQRGQEASAQLDCCGDRSLLDQLFREIGEANAARHTLIESNLRLVASVAKRYTGQGLPYPDLIQEGNIGLDHAIDKFNPHRGYRFATYAIHWIKHYVTRALDNYSRTIRIPANMIYRIQSATRSASRNGECEPTVDEIAENAGLPREEVERYTSLSQPLIELDMLADDDHASPGEYIEDSSPPLEDHLTCSMLHDEIESLLSSLSEQEAQVLQLRFGFRNREPLSLRQIGSLLGCSGEKVRQIEASALRRLRHPRYRRRLTVLV